MSRSVIGLLLASLLAAGCSREPAGRRYQLQGQILAVEADKRQVLIRHGDIPGFMPAMTMMFGVKDPALLAGKKPGDLVTATLFVSDTRAHLLTLDTTGFAPIAQEAGDRPVASTVPILDRGERVPNQTLVDAGGGTRHLADWQGQALALTFIYTRCPMPEFCPRMDRQFAEVQRAIAGDVRLAGRARLLSVTFDPAYDTPAVLAAHAKTVGANPAIWTFAAPPAADTAAFAGRFGVFVERPTGDAVTITHNLRTAIIDRDGRIVKVYTGNEWTPAEVVADLKAIVSAW